VDEFSDGLAEATPLTAPTKYAALIIVSRHFSLTITCTDSEINDSEGLRAGYHFSRNANCNIRLVHASYLRSSPADR
jgi:hypothetical protein